MSSSIQAAAARPAPSPTARPRFALWAAVIVYVIIAIPVALHHEPWADEAHSWLLARDASLYQLWTRLLHYEGTPGLWQSILHVLIRLHLPYKALNLVSAAAGLLGFSVLISYAPWPLPVRLALPFTYYLFYQYAIVARSYSLLPPLVFACAAAWSRSKVLFTIFTILLAAVSLDGFILAVFFYFDYLRTEGPGLSQGVRGLDGHTAIFSAPATAFAIAAWPAPDNRFVTHLNLHLPHFRIYTLGMFQYAFTGEWITTLLAAGLCIPLLWKGRTLPLFACLTVALCAIHAIVYMHVWHFGALTLAWLYCLWIATERTKSLPRSAAASLALIIAFQCYWTARTVVYDWSEAYSGSRDAAKYVKDHPEIADSGIRFATYSDEAIKPYFTHAELERITHASGPAFWDWSTRNTANDILPLFQGNRPACLIAGYKLPVEDTHWRRVAAAAGYGLTREFKGHLFWRTEVLEPESFNLYRRLDDPPGSRLKTSLDLGDPAAEAQLLQGFYDPQSGWRWTAKSFAVILKSPRSTATLSVDLAIPDIQLRDLGPMTLTAAAGQVPLGSRTFTNAGETTWTIDIPAGALRDPIAAIYFKADKARPPGSEDERELAIIVKSVMLEAK